ncbi:MAG: hypothetical protein MZW92_58760 [Comamonadaceae bacterium]|nr:hypothetical protein [Comamonadaceae bacterium]
MLRSLVFTCAAVSTLLLVVLALRAVGVPQIFRISEPPILLCLGVVCVANCVIFSVAAYMRAHREEPMLPPSVVGGIATAVIAYIGSRHSVLAMSVGYAVLTTCFLLPWSLAIFSRYYRRR